MAGAEELDGDAELKLLIRTKLRAEWSSENLAHSLLDEKMLANVVRVFPDLQPDEQARTVLALLCLPDPMPAKALPFAQQLVEAAAASPNGASSEWVPVAAALVAFNRPELACAATASVQKKYIDAPATQIAEMLTTAELRMVHAKGRAMDPLTVPHEFLYMSEEIRPSIPVAEPTQAFQVREGAFANDAVAVVPQSRFSTPAASTVRHLGSFTDRGTLGSGVKRKPVGLSHLLQTKKRNKKMRIRELSDIKQQQPAVVPGPAGSKKAAEPAWKKAAAAKFKHAVPKLKHNDWQRFLMFEKRAPNPNPAKPDYKFLIAIEPAKADGTRFAIMVKLNYATYKFNKVRVKVKTKPKKKSS